MKQKEVFKKIGGIIQELSDQYEYLQTVPDDLNDLELELFVSNAHFLTDHIEILCKLNLQNSKLKQPAPEKQETKKETKQEEKYFEPVVQQMKYAGAGTEAKKTGEPSKPVEIEITNNGIKEEEPLPQIDLKSEGAGETYSFIHEEPETIRHELILDETENWEDDDYALHENEASKVSKKRKNDAPAVVEAPTAPPEPAEVKQDVTKAEAADKTAEADVITINQKISSQLGEKAISKTEQLSIKPISDIKLAITLNDKLLYVKDLFNGYNLAYSEAIEILNRFNTFEEASRFLKTNYVTKNNWESKPATTEKFYALLKRRYA